MSLKKLIFVTFSFFLVQEAYSQRNFDDYNRLGITLGYSLFDINTSDFTTNQSGGFLGGFTTRGAFRNNFDLIYGLSFFSNNIEIFGKNPTNSFETQFIDYELQGVQIKFLGSYNIIKHHLSLEFGPILNISGKMKVKRENHEDYIIDGYTTLTAKDLENVSPVNFLLMGGITGGLESFRVSAQYQYGVTNMLNKLNDKDLEYSDFKGNSSNIIISLVVYF